MYLVIHFGKGVLKILLKVNAWAFSIYHLKQLYIDPLQMMNFPFVCFVSSPKGSLILDSLKNGSEALVAEFYQM